VPVRSVSLWDWERFQSSNGKERCIFSLFMELRRDRNLKGKLPLMRYLLCLLALSFFSFKSIDLGKAEDSTILGVWVQTDYGDKIYSFEKSYKLDKNRPGIHFKVGGKLIKRQNVGWCGTPPISYGNNDGKWSLNGDGKTIDLQYAFWGGTSKAKWEIVELTESTLKARVLEFSTDK